MYVVHSLQGQSVGTQCLTSSLNLYRVGTSFKVSDKMFQILGPINLKDSVP